jgi:hypothetical protein
MYETNNVTTDEREDRPDFFPKGSIAFFIILILFFVAVYFAFFALAIYRS